MKQTLLQVDDFAPDALAMRAAVIASPFSTRKGPDNHDYQGISGCAAPQWHALIEQALGRPIDVKLAFFRMMVDGELPHNWVHCDGIISRYAGLLYLNPQPQCAGGTAFWRHRHLNIDALPTPEAVRSSGTTDVDWFYGVVNRECKQLESWDQAGFVAMRFNRFITYPTAMFHSRYPFEGFGATPADARLTWACFYD